MRAPDDRARHAGGGRRAGGRAGRGRACSAASASRRRCGCCRAARSSCSRSSSSAIVMMSLGLRLAGWSEPESEAEFERIVEETERLARDGVAAEPDEIEFMDLDPYDDEDFAELVREAMDELPDILQRALERNVAVVISDGGRKAARLRPVPRRRRRPRRRPRPDRHLPRHAAPRLRPRPRPAAPRGHAHRPPRARAPPRRRRARRARPRPREPAAPRREGGQAQLHGAATLRRLPVARRRTESSTEHALRASSGADRRGEALDVLQDRRSASVTVPASRSLTRPSGRSAGRRAGGRTSATSPASEQLIRTP